jgi:hypothetical protein
MKRSQTPVAAAQKAVARVARQLSGLGACLKRIAETLPEAGLADSDQEPDFEVEMRSRIECVIVDSVETGIADLEAIARLEAPAPGRAERSARRR